MSKDALSKHSLYNSLTNSDFFQSSPDPTKHANPAKPELVDMGTDPMSVHKVSERQDFGSEYKVNSFSKQLSNQDKSVQAASDSSSKLLPDRKIKRKPTESGGPTSTEFVISKTDNHPYKKFVNASTTTKTQDAGTQSGLNRHSDSKIPPAPANVSSR